jgi:Ca2+-binding RTX toxin-like protein
VLGEVVTVKRAGSVLAPLVLAGSLFTGGSSFALGADASTHVRRPVLCHGHVATIVGHRADDVQGTGHEDVIVSNGASSVSGRGGDDVICMTGDGPRQLVFVSDGKGDDLITATTTEDRVTVALSDGDDTYLGNDKAEELHVYGTGNDVVDTGAGNDRIDLMQQAAGNGRAVIDGGPGNDTFFPALRPSSALLNGGPGRDKLYPQNYLRLAEGETDGPWTFDNKTHTARTSGTVWTRWKNISSFDFTFLKATRLTFRGSFREERADFSQVPSSFVVPRSVSALMGDGNDLVRVDALESGSIGGGTGTDRFVVVGGAARDDVLEVDLANGTAHTSSPDGTADLSLAGIQDASAFRFTTLTFFGSDDPNEFSSHLSCDSTFSGSGGDDVLVAVSVCGGFGDSQTPPYGTVTMDGGPGDDQLVGNEYTDDYLDGGDGNDTADGLGGTDTCIAETETNCELD